MKSSFLTTLLSRLTTRSALSISVVPLLFGALVLTGCGGGGSDEPDTGAGAVTPAAASAVPSQPQPRMKIGNEISYYEALQGDQRVGVATPHHEE